jgi:hypothetical protein
MPATAWRVVKSDNTNSRLDAEDLRDAACHDCKRLRNICTAVVVLPYLCDDSKAMLIHVFP